MKINNLKELPLLLNQSKKIKHIYSDETKKVDVVKKNKKDGDTK